MSAAISSLARSSTSCSATNDGILYQEEYKPFFLPLLVPVFYIMPLFWKYHVTITEDELSFGYSSGMTTKRVRHRKRVVKEATPLFDQVWWAGYGIKYRPDRDRGILERWERLYVANNGGAVKLVVEDCDAENSGNGGAVTTGANNTTTTTFFFSTNDPQQVCDILNNNNNK